MQPQTVCAMPESDLDLVVVIHAAHEFIPNAQTLWRPKTLRTARVVSTRWVRAHRRPSRRCKSALDLNDRGASPMSMVSCRSRSARDDIFPCWDYVYADQQGTARMGCCSRSARRCVLTVRCRGNLPSDPGALEMELSSETDPCYSAAMISRDKSCSQSAWS
ncbi:hypothetical protein HETIRDRAFT_150126 [Heterobasidion irregulare TC 32-1]|uniref:Uncharacterized protein n=1 Tax=Heterobasidion irregulare (strain TC 32-1) TaxID=747525 RepID=W4KKV2_HETIT|nr:uncharacterized protein HETIRDRAFT_150126 [Heterobasidion irregulare TC 32-1]ETW85696.1 hypothetical protein HETIRDRAFT_150126 [Heterobasidion irregulare TC 32-1]